MPVSAWSTTPADNGSTSGIDMAENCAAANVNDWARQIMADIKTKFDAIDAAIGGGAGDSQPLDATLTAIADLATAANKLQYWTGADAAALTDFTSFGRTVVATGDAAALLSLLGIDTAVSAGTFGANSVSVSMQLGSGGTLLLQGGTGSLAGDTPGTITFPTAYSVAPVCIVTGGSSNASHEGDVHPSAAATTTGIAIMNSNGSATCTYNWISLGPA